VQDPDDFLKLQKIVPQCIVDPSRAAIVDPAHRMRIGNDWFYFSSREARQKFLRDPLRYAAWLSDPVDHARFKATKRSPRAQRGGVTFYFAGAETRKAFAADPDSFYHARNMMLP
jgi:YHS domain-containing protein